MRIITIDAARGINSWNNSSVEAPLKYFVMEPEAAITNIKVV